MVGGLDWMAVQISFEIKLVYEVIKSILLLKKIGLVLRVIHTTTHHNTPRNNNQFKAK